MVGWRAALIFSLLRRFSDPRHLADQQADEAYRQYLQKRDGHCEPPGEPERQEVLRLLEEEIASQREEFAYAEKAHEETAAIEHDACLAPEGETWSMTLRQEATLDRSIDRKVRILLRLRKESINLPIAPAGQPDGARMENTQEVVGSDTMLSRSQGVTVENSKMKERSGNVAENKGSPSVNRERSGNVAENKGSFAQNAGMFSKGKGVMGNAAVRQSDPRIPAPCPTATTA
jgi:hypothetical protein